MAACSTDLVEPQWPPDLKGTWIWIETVEREDGGAVLSPTTEGYTAQLVLTSEATEAQHEGQYEYRVDGELAASGGFGLAHEDFPGNDMIGWDPPFADFHSHQWIHVSGDTIRLTDQTTGGYESTWVRAD